MPKSTSTAKGSPTKPPAVPSSSAAPTVDRRGFGQQCMALGLLGLAALAPIAGGLTMLLDPLRRKSSRGDFIPLGAKDMIDALPPNTPTVFSLKGSLVNAWNTLPDQKIGAVYLVRDEAGRLTAFQSKCPHQGCVVDYQKDQRRYFCPCHKAAFGLDGGHLKGNGPETRGLDKLEVKVDGDQVLVRYQEFRTGVMEQSAL